MTRVLLVWEDEYCEVLGEIAKRVVRQSLPSGPRPVDILRHTTRGNGAFERYVRTTWPLVRNRGLPMDPSPIDHLILAIDADRVHTIVGGDASQKPSEGSDTSDWHKTMEDAWVAWLRTRCAPNGPPPTTVHGVVFRWAKESLVLAGYDQPAMATHLLVNVNDPKVEEELRTRCKPDPRDVSDFEFTNTYRRPQGCLKVLREAQGLQEIKKNAPEVDDMLRSLNRESLPILRARVPDLDRLAALVRELHNASPSGTTTSEPSDQPSENRHSVESTRRSEQRPTSRKARKPRRNAK